MRLSECHPNADAKSVNKDNTDGDEEIGEEYFGEEWDFQREFEDLGVSSFVALTNSYIKDLIEQSGLQLLQQSRAREALRGEYKELGLFSFFYSMLTLA